jgi:hypothetical protein
MFFLLSLVSFPSASIHIHISPKYSQSFVPVSIRMAGLFNHLITYSANSAYSLARPISVSFICILPKYPFWLYYFIWNIHLSSYSIFSASLCIIHRFFSTLLSSIFVLLRLWLSLPRSLGFDFVLKMNKVHSPEFHRSFIVGRKQVELPNFPHISDQFTITVPTKSSPESSLKHTYMYVWQGTRDCWGNWFSISENWHKRCLRLHEISR